MPENRLCLLTGLFLSDLCLELNAGLPYCGQSHREDPLYLVAFPKDLSYLTFFWNGVISFYMAIFSLNLICNFQ